jgi:antitoxin VapB
MTQTTVFRSGKGQAVRLPKAFRFISRTIDISRRGDEIILREVPRCMGDLIAQLPLLGGDFKSDFADPLPEAIHSWDDVK